MTNLDKLKSATCSDGNCIFKVTPEMRKGMHTNGGCKCIDEARTDYDKKSGIRELSRVAAESLAKVAELETLVEKMKCCGSCTFGSLSNGWNDCPHSMCENSSHWQPLQKDEGDYEQVLKEEHEMHVRGNHALGSILRRNKIRG